jgi:hypothetical protein
MVDEQAILKRRHWLATVRGIRTHSSDGESIEEAPCDMPLGNAILHLASLDRSKFATDNASVIMEGLELDCSQCHILYERFGGRLAVVE